MGEEEGEEAKKILLPKSLHLRPDIPTMREVPWHKKEAIVLADVLNPADGQPLPYAPRNLLKTIIASQALPANLKS
jgi:glutamine synthetase